MFENIILSFQGIWSHKMRSFLTMLGIIIGIASIISIVSTIKGTNEQIKKNLIGSGNNTVKITLYDGEAPFNPEYGSDASGLPLMNTELIDKLKAVEGVENVTSYVGRDYTDSVYYKNSSFSGQIFGIDENYFQTNGYQVVAGRGFIEEDYKKFQKVILMDKDSANTLFTDKSALGETVEVKGEPFIIVGLVDKMDKFEPTINSLEDYYMYEGQSGGKMFMPINSWPIAYTFDEPQNIVIRTEKTEDMGKAGKACADILNTEITGSSETFKYKSVDLLEQAKKLQELSASTNQQLLWIASISLLVGGIGVMNIMLVSVTERTREIGLKKAIGARKGKILIQFLTEASVLTSLGGLLGVGCGIVLSGVISRISQVQMAISIPAIIGSVIFSMLIGIIFGLLPSIKAANLNPIDALRHE
jgi:putative ABC transport system permease protein